MEPEPVAVGAELLWVDPEPKFLLGAGAEKKSGARTEEKWLGSATLVRPSEVS